MKSLTSITTSISAGALLLLLSHTHLTTAQTEPTPSSAPPLDVFTPSQAAYFDKLHLPSCYENCLVSAFSQEESNPGTVIPPCASATRPTEGQSESEVDKLRIASYTCIYTDKIATRALVECLVKKCTSDSEEENLEAALEAFYARVWLDTGKGGVVYPAPKKLVEEELCVEVPEGGPKLEEMDLGGLQEGLGYEFAEGWPEGVSSGEEDTREMFTCGQKEVEEGEEEEEESTTEDPTQTGTGNGNGTGNGDGNGNGNGTGNSENDDDKGSASVFAPTGAGVMMGMAMAVVLGGMGAWL